MDERFKTRSLQLYEMFGEKAECYDALPAPFKEFVEIIGYARVCALMVRYDLKMGRSENATAIKYGLSRGEVRGIKGSRKRNTKQNHGQRGPKNTRKRG